MNDKWVKFKQVTNNFMFYRFAEGQGQGSDTTQEDIPASHTGPVSNYTDL